MENIQENKKNFTRKEKEIIQTKINKLSFESKKEILKYLISHGEKYSENNNGVMFDLMKLGIDTLNSINKFIIFTEQNEKEIEKQEEKANIYKDELIDE